MLKMLMILVLVVSFLKNWLQNQSMKLMVQRRLLVTLRLMFVKRRLLIGTFEAMPDDEDEVLQVELTIGETCEDEMPGEKEVAGKFGAGDSYACSTVD